MHSDLELLAATIDNETAFSGGRRVTDTYPGVPARQVMKKALADLESRIPLAMGFGLLSSFQLLLLPAIVQAVAAYLLRQRGDAPGLRFAYLVELSIPLTLVLSGVAYLFFQQPWLMATVPAIGIVGWLLIEFTRRWSVRSRRAVWGTLAVMGILGIGLAANSALLQTGWPFPGGNSPALYFVGAATVGVAVVQRWPSWRYVVYAIWAATLLSTFTGPAWSFPSSPEEIAASVRNSRAGTLLVLALTGLGAWYCSTPAWKQRRATSIAANSTPTALARRRIVVKRWTMIGVVGVLVAGAALIPIIQRQVRHQQLVDAIDRMQPDSIPEIKRLVAEGADIRAQGTDNTVAMVAGYWNDPLLLKQALDAGANPNAADSFGNTALHFATSLEPMRLLLAAGAKVNVQNKRGETPLMGAVRNAQFDQVKLLLEAGANVELVRLRLSRLRRWVSWQSAGTCWPTRPSRRSFGRRLPARWDRRRCG